MVITPFSWLHFINRAADDKQPYRTAGAAMFSAMFPVRADLSLPVQGWPFMTQSLIHNLYPPDRSLGPGSNLTPSQAADGSLPAVDCVSGGVISVILFPVLISQQEAHAPLTYLCSKGSSAQKEPWLHKWDEELCGCKQDFNLEGSLGQHHDLSWSFISHSCTSAVGLKIEYLQLKGLHVPETVLL